MTKEQEFLLAVRRLEVEYELFLSSDEGFWVDDIDFGDTLRSASSLEACCELETVAKEQGLYDTGARIRR